MPVSYYLNLCHYGGVWHPLAVCLGREVVGFVMWAFDPADRSGWVGGLTIDASWQGRGLGRATMEAMLDRLRDERRASAALSFAPDNVRAKRLYTSMGFVETGETEDDELVARRLL
jgi:diamine N-acetyltransferase